MHRALIAILVFVGTMWLPGRAVAAPHTFDGICQVTGLVSFKSYQSQALTFTGSGACTGLVDGEMLQDTPVSVRTSGSNAGFVIPVLGSGAGKLTFTKAGVTFPIAYQQLGAVLRVYPACMGCAGAAVGPIDSVTPTQPEPNPAGPRTMIRIVTQTVRTFTMP